MQKARKEERKERDSGRKVRRLIKCKKGRNRRRWNERKRKKRVLPIKKV